MEKSVDFVVKAYNATESFPSDEKFCLTSQIKRASVSIAANIAEGAGRKSDKEFLNFLSIAQGSASEVETELIIAQRLNYLNRDEYIELYNCLDEIGKLITGLSNHLKGKLK